MCTDAASFNLTSIEIAGAVREIDRVIAGSQNAADPDQVADDEANGGESRARCERAARMRTGSVRCGRAACMRTCSAHADERRGAPTT